MRIFNFGSRYAGWESDIAELFATLQDRGRCQAAIPTIPVADLLARLGELRYCILVPPGALAHTSAVFQCAEDDDRKLDPSLLDMLERAENAEDCRPETSNEREPNDFSSGFDEDYPLHGRNNDIVSANANAGNHGVRPRYAPRPTSVAKAPLSTATSVVVDCYGMYTPSLRFWLEEMACSLMSPAAHHLLRKLTQNEATDGPAVLLCPELIATAPEMVLRTAALSVRRAMTAVSNPTRLMLKLTLYHEIGHHVFPVHEPPGNPDCYHGRSYLAEALANWFVYNLANAHERSVLLEKSSNQAREYRAYRGLVWLEHGAADIPVWTGLFGPEWVAAIEKAAFERRLIGPAMDDEISKRMGGSIHGLELILHNLRGHLCPPMDIERIIEHLLPEDYEARAYGRILMEQAAPQSMSALRHLRHHALCCRSNSFPVTSKMKQRAWLDQVAEFPRRITDPTRGS